MSGINNEGDQEKDEKPDEVLDASNRDVDNEMSVQKAIAIIVGSLFTLGLVLGFISSGNGIAAGFTLIVAAGIWMIFTEEGREAWNDIQEKSQQQQQTDSSRSKPKRICSECGWQNPQRNNYCNDCGAELPTSNE